MESVMLLPFEVVECPQVHLKIPRIPLPGRMMVLTVILITYFFVFSGVVYDLINEPPSIGMTMDAQGRRRAEVIMPYRINGQYIVEGLSAGFLCMLGGVGIIVLDLASKQSGKWASGGMMGGILSVFIAYVGLLMFIKIKMPGY